MRNLTQRVTNGDWAIVDGYDGIVILNPTETTLFRYGKIQEQKKSLENRLMESNQAPAVTLDGVPVTLWANIEKADEVGMAQNYFAQGVGLFRTEFLFLNSARIPSEQEQFVAYKTVASSMAPNPVIIRTLDIGGDKEAPYLNLPKEDNPFLGVRGIRLCLARPDLFIPQLRAIYRAAAYGPIKIMFPMVATLEAVERAKAGCSSGARRDEVARRIQGAPSPS